MAQRSSVCDVYFENGFDDYMSRLSTFEQWTGTFDSKVSLARLGFSYTGIDGKVQCQFCNGKIYWEAGRDPYTEHKRQFPGCAFILQLDVDNRESLKPIYTAHNSRISSFPNHTLDRTPNELATSGFFYTGPGDKVECFHCGIILRNWQQDDDPMNTHKIYSPACTFIRNITDFQKLGISVTEKIGAHDIDRLRRTSLEGMVNDPKKQMLIDDINPESQLFQKLLRRYDSNTISREMIAKIQRTGKNFHTVDEFVSCVTQRHDLLSTKALGVPLDQLKAENNRLRQAKTCQQCMDTPVSIIFLPCGHLVMCAQCAQNVRVCPKCGNIIQGTVPIKMR